MKIRSVAILVGITSLLAFPAQAERVELRAHLAPGAGVHSPANGQGRFSYDTDTAQLQYSVTFENLSSVPTASHIHDRAAKVVVGFPVPESPISGTATLTKTQAAELLAGQLYVDVHTNASPKGEISGRIDRTAP